MTQYFTDFSEYSVNDDVRNADWSEIWDTFFSVEVLNDGNDNFLAVASDGSSSLSLLRWDDPESSANTEILALLSFEEHDHGITQSHYANASRVADPSSSQDAWRLGGYATDTLVIQSVEGGSSTTHASESMSFTGSTLYWFKSQSDGDFHRIKWWEDGTGEPGTWNLEVEETVVSSSGDSGFLLDYTTKVHIYRFGVGTNGDTAPSVGVQVPTGLTVSQNNGNLLADWTSSEGEFILQRERYVGSGEPS